MVATRIVLNPKEADFPLPHEKTTSLLEANNHAASSKKLLQPLWAFQRSCFTQRSCSKKLLQPLWITPINTLYPAKKLFARGLLYIATSLASDSTPRKRAASEGPAASMRISSIAARKPRGANPGGAGQYPCAPRGMGVESLATRRFEARSKSNFYELR